MKKILLIGFVLILFLAGKIAFAAGGTISVTPANGVKQGQTAFIKVDFPDTPKNPVFMFKGKKYRLFKSGENEYSGLLGISALEEPGKHELAVSDGTEIIGKTYINVLANPYPKQNIRVTKSMSGLGASEYELKQIGKAKYTVSEEKLRTNPPYNSPAQGCISSVFGLKRYYNGVFSGNYHNGVDIKASLGTPVKAITDGKVIIAEDAKLFRVNGTTVAIDHGQGLVSFYLHMSKLDVKAGDIVKAGQKIGEVGSTGFSTGPHLHWGLYIHGTPINPMAGWIKPVSLCK
jgi:murein DD-endopeptidase MepM/ murein hydrolase activator NlpD